MESANASLGENLTQFFSLNHHEKTKRKENGPKTNKNQSREKFCPSSSNVEIFSFSFFECRSTRMLELISCKKKEKNKTIRRFESKTKKERWRKILTIKIWYRFKYEICSSRFLLLFCPINDDNRCSIKLSVRKDQRIKSEENFSVYCLVSESFFLFVLWRTRSLLLSLVRSRLSKRFFSLRVSFSSHFIGQTVSIFSFLFLFFFCPFQ